MENQNQQEKIYDGLFKLSHIVDVKGVQKFLDKKKKIFFYKLYGAYCEKKRKLISQKLVINSSVSVKKYLWMIQQFYLNNRKKALFEQRHIEFAYQLNRFFRVCSRQRLNQAYKNIKGDQKNYENDFFNVVNKLKLTQAYKLKEFIFQYKQQYDDILKFRLCYFLKNLFEKRQKYNFSIFKFLSLNKKDKFQKEYVLQELKNRLQKKVFTAFLCLLNNSNKYQRLKYFLTNFSLIYSTKYQERLKQALFKMQTSVHDKLKSQNLIEKKLIYLQKIQDFMTAKQNQLQRMPFNQLKQNAMHPKSRQIALYMLKINSNDKLSYCFQKLKQNIGLSGQKYFPLIFLLNKKYEKVKRNAYESIVKKYKEQRSKERNKKNSITNLNLIIQRIVYQNQINAKIKSMNEMKKKIRQPMFKQQNKQASVQNTIILSNIQKHVIKKNKALKFFAFQRWKMFKDGAVKNLYSMNPIQKQQLRQNQMNQKIDKKINFVCNTQRLESLLKTLIKVRKIVTLRLLKQKRKMRFDRIKQNSCKLLAKQLKVIKNKNQRINLYKMKLSANKLASNQIFYTIFQ